MTGASIRFPHLGIVIEHLGKSISIFGFDIAYYGIIIGVGMLCGIAMAVHEAKRTGQNPEMYYDFALCAIVSAIVGCRIYYVAFEWSYYSQHPLEIFNLRQGGLAIYGGIIGGFICMIIFSKIRKASLLLMADTVVPGLLIGQIIGRWGNFFNGEAHGPETTREVLEGIKIIPKFVIDGMNIAGTYYQPTFYYEFLWCLLGFVILLCVRKFYEYLKVGQLTGIYLMWYGIGRFFVESLRTDSLMLKEFKVAQIVSVIMFVVGLIMLILGFKGSKFENRYDDYERSC